MKIVLILLLALSVHAGIKQKMFGLYQNKQYEQVCNMGFEHFNQNVKDEEYISLYAFACLHADNIDRLATPVALLKFSKEARANSAYFSVILMQKKLLYHALNDNYELSTLKLPTTDYVLSKVFDLYVHLGKHQSRSFYLFHDPDNSKITYKLYLARDEKRTKMIIEEYYDAVSVKRHEYW